MACKTKSGGGSTHGKHSPHTKSGKHTKTHKHKAHSKHKGHSKHHKAGSSAPKVACGANGPHPIGGL